jgi:cephalosporin hydroxylase
MQCLEWSAVLPDAAVVDFHRLYYESRVWLETQWLGTPTQKCPLDLWIYEELLVEVKPDLIIETGTAAGGSALYLASICDLIGKGRVVTIDVATAERPRHPRIVYITGSSTDPAVVARLRKDAADAGTILVVLDSDHRLEHVRGELNAYAPLVTRGSYLIVEDTNLNGRPVVSEHGPGPAEAVAEFLAANNRFEIDRSREKFGLTFNPGGYLRCIG